MLESFKTLVNVLADVQQTAPVTEHVLDGGRVSVTGFEKSLLGDEDAVGAIFGDSASEVKGDLVDCALTIVKGSRLFDGHDSVDHAEAVVGLLCRDRSAKEEEL